MGALMGLMECPIILRLLSRRWTDRKYYSNISVSKASTSIREWGRKREPLNIVLLLLHILEFGTTKMMQCHSLLLLQMLAPYLALLLLGPAAAFSPLSPVISRTPLGRHGSTTSSYHQGGSTSFAFDRTAPLNLFSPFARATKAEKTAQTTATIIQTPTGPMTMPSGASAPVTVITSPQELADFLNQDDRLCVIK